MAKTEELDWQTLEDVYLAVRAFVEPALSGRDLRGVWSPEAWRWLPRD